MSEEAVLEQCSECSKWWESQEEIEEDAIFFDDVLICQECFGEMYRQSCIEWDGEEPTDEEIQALIDSVQKS